MPEKPEVITVSKKLSNRLIGKKIENVNVLWPNIIMDLSVDDFQNRLKGEEFLEITTRGKWLVFTLSTCILLVHLRMEGKFFFRSKEEEIKKHEHVIFTLESGESFRFHDTRKFGKMKILSKENYDAEEPFLSLGLEVWDKSLNSSYLMEKFKKKSLSIKLALLDQTIITGIGNIYADEILFLSKIHPLTSSKDLTEADLVAIIKNAKVVLDKAIEEGGTTIHSYTSEEGVTGLFQNYLLVHSKDGEKCTVCGSKIIKIKVGGRGTYFCDTCQKERTK